MRKYPGVIFVILLLFAFSAVGYGYEKNYAIDQEYQISPGGTVELHTDDANIKIIGEERENVELKVNYSLTATGLYKIKGDFRVDVRNINGNLIIEEKNNQSMTIMVGSSREDYDITIRVPEGVSLKLYGDDDNYHMEGIAGDIFLKIDDGRANIRNSTSNRYTLFADDGVIRIDQGQGLLSGNFDDGDLYLTEGNFTKIALINDDGYLDVATQLNSSGDYKIESDDGKIKFRVLNGGGEFYLRGENVSIVDGFEVKYRSKDMHVFQLSSGDAEIGLTVDDGRIQLLK